MREADAIDTLRATVNVHAVFVEVIARGYLPIMWMGSFEGDALLN